MDCFLLQVAGGDASSVADYIRRVWGQRGRLGFARRHAGMRAAYRSEVFNPAAWLRGWACCF